MFSTKKPAQKRKSENAAALPPKLGSVKLAQLLAEEPETVIGQSYGAIQAISALALKSRKTKEDIRRVVHAVSNCKYLLLFLMAKVYEEDLKKKKVVEFNDVEKVLHALDINERFVAVLPPKKRRKRKTKTYIIPEPINDTTEEHMAHLITCLEKSWGPVALPQNFDGWTGEDALEYMFGTGPYDGRDAEATPEFILLDVHLPKIDGLQVLEQLRGDERTHLVPVILFSSSNEHKDVVKGYELGANSYVTKPANFDRFSEAMQYLGWYWLNFNETP